MKVRRHLWISVICGKSIQLYLCIPYQSVLVNHRIWIVQREIQINPKTEASLSQQRSHNLKAGLWTFSSCLLWLTKYVLLQMYCWHCWKHSKASLSESAGMQTLLKHYLKLLPAECWRGSATAAHEIINSEDKECLKSNQWLIHNHIVCFVKQTDFT